MDKNNVIAQFDFSNLKYVDYYLSNSKYSINFFLYIYKRYLIFEVALTNLSTGEIQSYFSSILNVFKKKFSIDKNQIHLDLKRNLSMRFIDDEFSNQIIGAINKFNDIETSFDFKLLTSRSFSNEKSVQLKEFLVKKQFNLDLEGYIKLGDLPIFFNIDSYAFKTLVYGKLASKIELLSLTYSGIQASHLVSFSFSLGNISNVNMISIDNVIYDISNLEFENDILSILDIKEKESLIFRTKSGDLKGKFEIEKIVKLSKKISLQDKQLSLVYGSLNIEFNLGERRKIEIANLKIAARLFKVN